MKTRQCSAGVRWSVPVITAALGQLLTLDGRALPESPEVLIKMAGDPGFKESMRKAGADTVKSTPEQYRAQIRQEIAQWKPLIGEIADKK